MAPGLKRTNYDSYRAGNEAWDKVARMKPSQCCRSNLPKPFSAA